MPPAPLSRSGPDLTLAAVLVAAALAIEAIYLRALWTFDGDGLSVLSDRLAFWDFSNLWAGGRMALDGHVAWLFDAEAYRAALRQRFTPLLPDQEWSYPPHLLLIGAPLALLPILPAYLLWTAGTLGALHLALRPLRLPVPVHLAVLAGPSAAMNVVFGQNGALTAALLLGGLIAAERRPWLAGVLFGLLTVKPHLGLLLPVCLLASGNWRAILSAAATAAVLGLATGLLFGFSVWPLFFGETAPLMRAIMEAPYPQPYHANAMTVFVLARSLDAGLGAAYAVQGLAAAACGVAAWRLWRDRAAVEPRLRALATAVLALLATPYGYSYDTIPMAAAIGFAFACLPNARAGLLGLAWLSPLVVHLANFQGWGVGALAPGAVALALLRAAARTQPAAPLTACAAPPPPPGAPVPS